ncbi:MAG: hypothetical protein Q4A43_03335 [Coriobacteriia bacterium]|nr:hypothetical protein [Coriobacteriia bacterium]
MDDKEFEDYVGVAPLGYSSEFLKGDVGNYHRFRLDLRYALGEYGVVKDKIIVSRAKKQMAKDAIAFLMPMRIKLEDPDVAWMAIDSCNDKDFELISRYVLNLRHDCIPSLMRLCAYTKYSGESTRETIDSFPEFLRYGKAEDRFKGVLEREFDRRRVKR